MCWILFAAAAAQLFFSADSASSNFTYSTPGSTEICELVGKPRWITTVVTQVMAGYIPSGEKEDGLCTQQGLIYADHLANLTYWATKMYDASSLGVPGILEGRNIDFGHFDECASVSSVEHKIKGKYVVARLIFSPSRELYPYFNKTTNVWKEPEPEDSAWDAIKPTTDRRISQRNMIQWALCVPASCTDLDIQTSLRNKLYPALAAQRLTGNLTMLSSYSYSRESDTHQPGISFYVFVFVAGVILTTVALSTFHEFVLLEEEQVKKPWYSAFSMKANLIDLFKLPRNEFACISGMKVISMFLIIYGHRMLISLAYPQFNPKNVQLASGTYFATIFENGIIIVNTFLTITGFLTFYKITKDIYSNNELQPFKNIFKRWLRLTPAYLAVMSIHYYLFPFVEGGPMGRSVVWSSKTFGQYWWTHLLYINNYVKMEYQCLIPSWYMALDMQMYAFCYLLAGLLAKRRKLIPYVLVMASILSLVAPAIMIAYKGYYGTYRVHHTNVFNYFSEPEFQEMYLPTHIRASPYIIGMLGGYFFYHVKAKGITFNKGTMWFWTIISTVVLKSCLSLSWPFYIPGREYVLWENIAYSIFHRLGWAVSVCWIIFASAIGHFDLLKVTVCFRTYEPLNKLNYCALLSHSIIQVFLIGYLRSPVNYGWIMGIWMSCGDIIFTYAFSVFLYCIVEAPFSQLQQKLWTVSIFSKKTSQGAAKN